MLNQNLLLGDDGYLIQRSLRFRSSATAYLSRTPASASNRKTWTWSGWVKRGSLGTAQRMFQASPTSFLFQANDTLLVDADGGTSYCITSAVYRDISAWYHIVINFDTAQATATNRIKIYVNGVQQAVTFTGTVTLNYDGGINNTVAHYTGTNSVTNQYLDGYLTETNFIDGQALTPSSFGETDLVTGVWKPKKYAGTYGTNGFYLPFSDNSSTTTLGYDKSGNSNNWTCNNISVTAGSTYDSMTDVPTLTSATAANYCVLNPLNTDSSITVRDGNLFATWTGSANKDTLATISPTSGKFYCEVYQSAGATADVVTGFCLVTYNRNSANMVGDSSAQYLAYTYAGRKWDKGTQTNGLTTLAVSTDHLCFAIDYDAGKAWAGKNGVWFASGDPATGANPFWTFTANSQYTFGSPIFNGSFSVNFGQRPFSYTPPTGFLALNTFNLPEPSIKAGNKHFDATTYTGNGGTQSIVNAGGFSPDLVWIKPRAAAVSHSLYDTNRGAFIALASDITNAESNLSPYGVSSFNGNGFTVADIANGGYRVNGAAGGSFSGSSAAYIGWQWKAGGTAVSNTAGSITSQVSANASAGFSVVTYTGTGANATVGHGLGIAPKMVIVKKRNNTGNWRVYHTGLTSAAYAIYLDLTNAQALQATEWNSTAPTSSVFSLGTSTGSNAVSDTFVAYCFSEVAGYSKAFSYTGNGSADGAFVHLGFRPKFVMLKRTDAVDSWYIFDTSINPYNVTQQEFQANTSNPESTATNAFDIVSNGIKLRTTGTYANASGGTYIYMAFAENPTKFSLAR